MAKPPYKKPPGLIQRAEASLAATGHSVFNQPQYQVRDQYGSEVAVGWIGPEVERATVHEPTLVTRAWRIHFWPNKFMALLPSTLARDEVQQAADNLLELMNMRRKGGL